MNKKEPEISEEPVDGHIQYHNDCILMSQFMALPGWQVFLKRWAEKKKRLELKILKTEVDIEIGGIEKKTVKGKSDITILVLNKDENKIKKTFIESLESEFKDYQAEANRQLEEENG